MKRFAAALVIGALGVYFLIGARNKGISYETNQVIKREPPKVELPRLDSGRPIAVLVRGWLWDPISRSSAEPLVQFPSRLQDRLDHEFGLAVQVVQFEWSRMPTLIVGESKKFTDFARAISAEVSGAGGCVAFIGHSAGAAMVYSAASHGVPMGYMGTLGLPTVGSAKPKSVEEWGNFYTSTHKDDFAGKWWGAKMRADLNVDLRMPHKDFWDSAQAAHRSADAIARTWQSCGS